MGVSTQTGVAVKRILSLSILVLLAAAPAAAAQSHLLVVSGLAGEPQHEQQFHAWSTALVDAARERYGVGADRITYLAEKPDRDQRISGESTRTNIDAAITRIAREAGPNDRVLILLIGHGNADGQSARINLPGPDLTASDLAGMLNRFTTQSVVVVNAASASGAFQEPLAGRNRTIITATRSGSEQNETVFARFFTDAYAGDGADADKDGSITVLEAYDYANREVERFYQSSNRLQTEHSVLAGDREVARSFGLGGRTAAAAATVASPEVRGLVAEREALEAQVQALTARKDAMEPDAYQRELERLLLELARKNQEIRAKEGT